MYLRSDSLTLSARPPSFGLARAAARSTEPEVFTFERIPAQATAARSCVPLRPRKRCTRVMYPAKVRMHLPPPERSRAKRWLLVLVLVVLWQIYTEEPCADAPPGGPDGPLQPEERAPQPLSAAERACEERGSSGDPNSTCPLPGPEPGPLPGPEPAGSRSFEQSAGNGYMVALLVYHRLGSDN